MKEAIQDICILLAKTYKNKIIDLVPKLCQECNYTDPEERLDESLMSKKIMDLAKDPVKDNAFLSNFAMKLMFVFLTENYLAAVQQK